MQASLSFLAADIERWDDALRPLFDVRDLVHRRPPIGQLIKSMISGRTRDAVSQSAYHRLCARYPTFSAMAKAAPAAIEREISAVTFADSKARHLASALRRIERERPDFDLGFLGAWPLDDALAWLERLPGVARKVSASTLNASTLGLPVFIADSHVVRVLGRLGFIGPSAGYRDASVAVTAAMPGWGGDDFLRFHIVVKRLGQLICRPDLPSCSRCPLNESCPFRRRRSQGLNRRTTDAMVGRWMSPPPSSPH